MKEKNITVVSRDAPRRKGKTDWERLRNTTDEEIEAQIASDPDFSDDWNWSDAVLVIPSKKKAAGYQRRINAVLRSYMQQKTSKKKRAK